MVPKSEDNPTPVQFDHPYLQTLLMMIGELSCLLVFYALYKLAKEQAHIPHWKGQLLFVLPVLCDMTATTLINYAYYLDLHVLYLSVVAKRCWLNWLEVPDVYVLQHL